MQEFANNFAAVCGLLTLAAFTGLAIEAMVWAIVSLFNSIKDMRGRDF